MPRQQASNKQTSPTKIPTSFQVMGPILPRPQNQAPAATSFGQIVKEGFGFGVGSAVARQVVDSLFRSVSSSPEKKEGSIVPSVHSDENRILYNQCMIEGGIHDICKDILQ